ncbi:MAG: hypothetical protein ACLUKE_08660 [Blautia wexlerae]
MRVWKGIQNRQEMNLQWIITENPKPEAEEPDAYEVVTPIVANWHGKPVDIHRLSCHG